jgi:hypothetical protein
MEIIKPTSNLVGENKWGSVIKYLTLRGSGMIITEIIEEFVLVSVVPVGNLTVVFLVPLVLFVMLVSAEGDLKLFVLVGDVCHFL